MIKINSVKLWWIGEGESLSLLKEKPKYLDKTTNKAVNDLVTFQLQLEKIKSSLKKQFSSLK